MKTNEEYLMDLKEELAEKRGEYNDKLSKELVEGNFKEYQKYDMKRELVQAKMDLIDRIISDMKEIRDENKSEMLESIKEGKLIDKIKEWKNG